MGLRRIKYLTLLLCLLYMLVIAPFGKAKVLSVPLDTLGFALLLFLAAFAISQRRWTLAVTLPLGGLALGTLLFLPGWVALGQASAGLFLLFTTVLLHLDLAADTEVTEDTLAGAMAGFLLLSVSFAMVHATIESIAPGSYSIAHKQEQDFLQFFYFSLVTITTLGYGDVLPLVDGSRSLAAFEAVVGQFYFAVLVAKLLATYLSNQKGKTGLDLPAPEQVAHEPSSG